MHTSASRRAAARASSPRAVVLAGSNGSLSPSPLLLLRTRAPVPASNPTAVPPPKVRGLTPPPLPSSPPPPKPETPDADFGRARRTSAEAALMARAWHLEHNPEAAAAAACAPLCDAARSRRSTQTSHGVNFRRLSSSVCVYSPAVAVAEAVAAAASRCGAWRPDEAHIMRRRVSSSAARSALILRSTASFLRNLSLAASMSAFAALPASFRNSLIFEALGSAV
mmetsp:Transcript_12777/g.31081  ORF Transcript_12777/g.31081 Transcript_12777/m.31081 type:complete len:224 (+) Transcript_12777:202-873(+)